jgi:chromosome partitioning protein
VSFGDQLLHSKISRTVKFPDSTVAAEPITEFAPKSPAADAYRELAYELIFRGAVK